jgi:hypothetical protein
MAPVLASERRDAELFSGLVDITPGNAYSEAYSSVYGLLRKAEI